MFEKKVKAKIIKYHCDKLLEYLQKREKNSRISKGEKEVLEYVKGIVSRMKGEVR